MPCAACAAVRHRDLSHAILFILRSAKGFRQALRGCSIARFQGSVRKTGAAAGSVECTDALRFHAAALPPQCRYLASRAARIS